jgi:hypothetical protein
VSLKRFSLSRVNPVRSRLSQTSLGALRCRRKFLKLFPAGFQDQKYLAWERNYKWQAHQSWQESLAAPRFRQLLREKKFIEAAAQAVRIESRTNLLFSFEKMALRDAVRGKVGAELFAVGLYEFLHGRGSSEKKFEQWCQAVGSLPRRQTRVLTWPLVTVFAFIAQPDQHIFLKPKATQVAAAEHEFNFDYSSRPSFETYESLLQFAEKVRRDLKDLRPRDFIDLQSFIWVQGSDEYA